MSQYAVAEAIDKTARGMYYLQECIAFLVKHIKVDCGHLPTSSTFCFTEAHQSIVADAVLDIGVWYVLTDTLFHSIPLLSISATIEVMDVSRQSVKNNCQLRTVGDFSDTPDRRDIER